MHLPGLLSSFLGLVFLLSAQTWAQLTMENGTVIQSLPASTGVIEYQQDFASTDILNVSWKNISAAAATVYTIPLSGPEDPLLSITALCWYPVSAYYGQLPRVLFYATMLFAVFARNHKWLVLGALGASMTYAGTIAIHSCIIIWSNSGWGNSDVYPIFGLLFFASTVVIPLLTWSKTIRDLGKEHEEDTIGRSIIIAWGILIFVGFITMYTGIILGGVSRLRFDLEHGAQSPAHSYSEVFSCTPDNGVLNLTAGQDEIWRRLYITQEFIDVNACSNPCGQLTLPTVLRDSDDLVALTRNQVNEWTLYFNEFNSKHPLGIDLSYILVLFGGLALIWAMFQTFTVLLYGRRTPTEVRNKTYTIFDGLLKNFNCNERVSSFIAKVSACILYLYGVVATLISMILMFMSVFGTEFVMGGLVMSDRNYEVDQWAGWVATCLVLFAAVLYRYEGIFEDLIMKTLNALMKGMHMILHGPYSNTCQPDVDKVDKEYSRTKATSNRELVTQQLQKGVKRSTIAQVFSLPKTKKVILDSWKDSKLFWFKPQEAVQNNTGKSHCRKRKVVNFEDQKFPENWKQDEDEDGDWLTIDKFVQRCYDCDDLRKSETDGRGYKWQPRVIENDEASDAKRKAFNRVLLLDLFMRHKTEHKTTATSSTSSTNTSEHHEAQVTGSSLSDAGDDQHVARLHAADSYELSQIHLTTNVLSQTMTARAREADAGERVVSPIVSVQDDETHARTRVYPPARGQSSTETIQTIRRKQVASSVVHEH